MLNWSQLLKVIVIICPGEKGPEIECTRPGGLVKFPAMDSIDGIPSGGSCTSMVREEEVEDWRERVGTPVEMWQPMAIMTRSSTISTLNPSRGGERWGDGEVGRWEGGEVGRWGDGEMGR